MDYQEAGVNLVGARTFVERIRRHTQSTTRPGVLGGIGQFGGLFALGSYQEPILVSGCDGVGTKLKLAFALQKHDTIGIDCVAMSVNDILCQGAEPLFFLDYISTGKLDIAVLEQVVAGMATGCREAGCALLGGETAEMPGFYPDGEYDVAGFAVGVVEKAHALDGSQVQVGDVLVGLGSSGLHSNGFSLVRRILETQGIDLMVVVEELDGTVGEVLLTPTRLYVKPVLAALRAHMPIHGLAHITGGGLVENVPRALGGKTASIQRGSWTMPPIFNWLQQQGQLTQTVLDETFNQGIGMVIAVPATEGAACQAFFQAQGLPSWIIGIVQSGSGGVVFEGQPTVR
jgi:phosphoribosylformylglycinamidine cyclo-ligase